MDRVGGAARSSTDSGSVMNPRFAGRGAAGENVQTDTVRVSVPDEARASPTARRVGAARAQSRRCSSACTSKDRCRSAPAGRPAGEVDAQGRRHARRGRVEYAGRRCERRVSAPRTAGVRVTAAQEPRRGMAWSRRRQLRVAMVFLGLTGRCCGRGSQCEQMMASVLALAWW